MERGVMLTYKNTKRQFFISSGTKPHIINTLIKRAFHIQSELKQFRHPRGYLITINQIFQLQNGRNFQVLTDDQHSLDKDKSQNYSQKNMAKSSGRKFPPSEKQLLDSKFFIQDFQLFISQASTKNSNNLYGIIFFSSKKKAQFLGKKILRQLIFEFDKIQFFYALHPIKTHSTSALLGEMLLFTIFQCKTMIIERQFPQNITAIEQIFGYLKAIIKNGDLKIQDIKQQPSKQQNKPKNLIFVQEQRSFDQKAQKPLDSLDPQFSSIKNINLFQNNLTPQSKIQQIPPIFKIQTQVKTNFNHQISFQTQFYQPTWFAEGQHLTRLERTILSSLIRANDSNFIKFCSAIDLKNNQQQSLHVKLMKVFLKEIIDQKLSSLNPEIKKYIETNQQNRQTPIFSLLLKLNKFGTIEAFVENVQNCMKKNQEKNKQVVSPYITIVREVKILANNFGLRLMNCEQNESQKQMSSPNKLIAQSQQFHQKNLKIASVYHKSHQQIYHNKTYHLPKQFDQAQVAIIKDKILKGDPFLIENYIPSQWKNSKIRQLNIQTVRKYLKSNQIRYKFLDQLSIDEDLKYQLSKLETFRSLLYFLYKQRIINKKQQKIFLYLYTWSDLNILGTFELYMLDRNLEQFIESIYAIDQTYYLYQKYQLQMSDVQNFSVEIELQLVILMLYGEWIKDVNIKIAIEKFVRAGDVTLMKIVKQNHQNRSLLIQKLIQFGNLKKLQLEQISKKQIDQSEKLEEKKKEMKIFVKQIIPIHFKDFKKYELVCECIDLQQPLITSIFNVYYQTKELVDWIQSFELYIKKLQQTHMGLILKEIVKAEGLQYQKILQSPTDMLKGIYELYLYTKNYQDTKDSIKRLISRQSAKK